MFIGTRHTRHGEHPPHKSFYFLYRKKYIYSTLAVPTDKDGRMMNLNYNSEATKIFQENTSVKGIDIVGQAVVVKKGWMNIEIETE